MDTRSTASTPLFGYEAAVDDDSNPTSSLIFDWTPSLSTNNTTQKPICSQGFMNLLTQYVDPDVEVLTQLLTPSSGGKGASKRGSNYNHDEDIQLCESWINVTYDPIIANEQPGKTYWKRIRDHYNENKKTHLNKRNASSIEHIWGVIQKDCIKFQGYFKEVERRRRSGIPYTEYLIEAQATYSSSDPKGKAFQFTPY